MTNEVEKLILEKNNFVNNLSYKEINTYKLYKELWFFILESLKYEPDYIKINIFLKKVDDNRYLSRTNDVNYKIYGSSFENEWNEYFKNYSETKIRNITRNCIDIDLIKKLLGQDNINIRLLEKENSTCLTLFINYKDVDKIIENILLKNGNIKKLIKEV